MLPDKNIKCPATGFTKSCHSIVAKCTCPKFVAVKGKNAAGEIVDLEGCVDAFLPMLLIENAQMSRQTGAAVESFRNEVVKAYGVATQERRSALEALGFPKVKVLE
jgi:hypothetical protein